MKIVEVKRESFYGEMQLVVVFEDGSEEFLVGYLPSEYSILDSELIGETQDEAKAIVSEKIRSVCYW